jgi:membrane associated rhomboid family serine protease
MQNWIGAAAEGSIAAQNSIHMLKMTPTVGASGAIYGVLWAMRCFILIRCLRCCSLLYH